MNIENVRNYCLKLKGVTEGFPFDEDTLVFKVLNKIFCLGGLTPPFSINLKCDPEKAVELRERYDYVTPGYHMNKNHWNTIMLENVIKEDLVYEWIDWSYNLVIEKMTKKEKEQLSKF